MRYPKAEIDRKTALKLWRQERSEYAKEQMLLSNQGPIGVAMKRIGINRNDEDLEQVGMIGLFKALRTFDFKKKIGFATYAVIVIENELRQELKRENRYAKLLVAFSLDDTFSAQEDSEVTYADMIAGDRDVEHECICGVSIQEITKSLSEVERKILALRILGKNQRYIANQTGLSQSYVSRAIKSICRKYEKFQ